MKKFTAVTTPIKRWWARLLACIRRSPRSQSEPPVEPPPKPPEPEELALGPYRAQAVDDLDKHLYEDGVAAIEHLNRGCPRGFILFPILVTERTYSGYHIEYVTKHRTMYFMKERRYWSEFCCQEELQALEDADKIQSSKWTQHWWKARENLLSWMVDLPS